MTDTKTSLAEIKEKQTILRKYRDDYESCTFDEDLIAGSSYDQMVTSIDFLIDQLEQALVKIARLEGDCLAVGGTLNYIVGMKDECYSKWNLWHHANNFFNEIDSKMHHPETLKVYLERRSEDLQSSAQGKESR